jgi:hypothetical protein
MLYLGEEPELIMRIALLRQGEGPNIIANAMTVDWMDSRILVFA